MEDIVPERIGSWMHTSTGKKFFPLDPRPEEICISDIANGLALDCRYAGQGRVDRYYSVAEHSYHMAMYAAKYNSYSLCLAVLLHDAAEAYLNDLPRAVKLAVGQSYKSLEDNLQDMIFEKYNVLWEYRTHKDYIKNLDNRMVNLEKVAIMRYPQPWAHDQYEPLDLITIRCFDPETAKRRFIEAYRLFSKDIVCIPYEEIEI